MASEEVVRTIQVENVPAPDEETSGGGETVVRSLLETGVRVATFGVELLPPAVSKPVMGIARRVLRGAAGLVRDAAELLDSTADRL